MKNLSPTSMGLLPQEIQENTTSDWAVQSYDHSSDSFGDTSWIPVDNTSGQMPAGYNHNFPIGLCSRQYDMSIQPHDTMQFDTLGPAELNTHVINDIASSIQSWPVSPDSLPGIFSDAVPASTHTSPDDVGTESPSSRHHKYQQPQQHRIKSQITRSKRRASSSASRPQTTTTAVKIEIDSPSASTTIATGGTRSKKKTIRERNRTAATKYRNKTKKEIEKLREKESQLSEKNNILRADVEYLRNEIFSLKTEILRHGTCESPPIQEYIMKTAKQLLASRSFCFELVAELF
ncbi:hypothetical protein Micbo1qcDRAFT_178234 [Microdochium bolleyi]|uniref:BZIP domain-containing protein n=1 Tax=Microdochium bolleyi TaxID=196109 RepID=A0A136ITG2_9PEZI|nr:hypothetical protein Micbo1qcDRAFT_178234 [Microdochium bolleyi]